jgi:hypothetical protein
MSAGAALPPCRGRVPTAGRPGRSFSIAELQQRRESSELGIQPVKCIMRTAFRSSRAVSSSM